MKDHEYFMKEAIIEAKKAETIEEVPIGCVIVMDNEIISRGYNRRNTEKNPLYHAEIIAINDAAKKINDWRLEWCTMYVTVEPCPMCAGAIVQSRIPRVVFGARNKKAGCAGSILDILNDNRFNHRVDVIEGVMQEKCGRIMSEFFSKLRKNI